MPQNTKRGREYSFNNYVTLLEEAQRGPERVADRFQRICAERIPDSVNGKSFFVAYASQYFTHILTPGLYNLQLHTDMGLYQGMLENWQVTMRDENRDVVVGPQEFIDHLIRNRASEYRGKIFPLTHFPQILDTTSWDSQYNIHGLEGIYRVAFSIYMMDMELACHHLRVVLTPYMANLLTSSANRLSI